MLSRQLQDFELRGKSYVRVWHSLPNMGLSHSLIHSFIKHPFKILRCFKPLTISCIVFQVSFSTQYYALIIGFC